MVRENNTKGIKKELERHIKKIKKSRPENKEEIARIEKELEDLD